MQAVGPKANVGKKPEQARFQAPSSFTNTGFTTEEAEEISRLVAPSFGVVRDRITVRPRVVDVPLRRDSVITIPEGDDVLQSGGLVTRYGDVATISECFSADPLLPSGDDPASGLRREGER